MTDENKLVKSLILSTLLSETLEDLESAGFCVQRLKQRIKQMKAELDKYSNKVFDNCTDTSAAANYVFEVCKKLDKTINENL